MNQYKYYFITLLASIIYALYIVVNKEFLHRDFNPIMFAFGSSLFGTILCFFILLFSSDLTHLSNVKNGIWKKVIIYGLIAGVVARTLLFFGQSYISATNAGFLLGGSRPIFSFIFGYVFMRETIYKSQALIILIMIFGVFLLTSNGQMSIHTGDILLILCGMILGSSHALSRQITRSGLHPLALTFFEMLVSTAGLLIIAFLTASISFSGWSGWFLSGLFISLGVAMRNTALSHIKAPIFSSLVLTSPVFSAFIGITFFNEKLGHIQLLGGLIILLGGYILIWIKK